jgi:MYXO-CTERM domain-containing protein
VVGIDEDDAPHFTLRSDDDAVISVDSVDKTSATASCTAHAPGTAGIHVLRDGSEVYSAQVSVAAPTRAVLQPAGPLFVGDPLPLPASGTTQVVNGGTATYQVTYFDGDQPLFGNGVISAMPSAGITVLAEKTFLFQVREWLQVTPNVLGAQTVQLEADGIPLGTLTVSSVAESAVKRVSVESQDPSGAQNGDELVVLAQAFDDEDRPIFGVDYTWNLSGEEQDGEGDLFDFTLDSSQSSEVEAQFGGLSASTSIDAKPGSGFVSSSNDIGCSAAPGAPAGGFAALALAAVALAAGARRRRVVSVTRAVR